MNNALFPDFENEMQLNFCSAFDLSKNVNNIGVRLSNRIVNERNQNGDFKDWKDVQKRVYGVGLKTIQKLKNSGVKIDKFHVYESNQHVQQKGFEIEYVKLGPQTVFSKKIDEICKGLRFDMQKAQNKKKRTLDQSKFKKFVSFLSVSVSLNFVTPTHKYCISGLTSLQPDRYLKKKFCMHI